MRVFLILILVSICLSSCLDFISDHEQLEKDFYLEWNPQDERYKHIVLSDDIFNGGLSIVSETVYEIAHNKDFILAKRHPHLYANIEMYDTAYFESGILNNQADSATFSSDQLYKKDGKWYLVYNYMKTHNDTLYPY